MHTCTSNFRYKCICLPGFVDYWFPILRFVCFVMNILQEVWLKVLMFCCTVANPQSSVGFGIGGHLNLGLLRMWHSMITASLTHF